MKGKKKVFLSESYTLDIAWTIPLDNLMEQIEKIKQEWTVPNDVEYTLDLDYSDEDYHGYGCTPDLMLYVRAWRWETDEETAARVRQDEISAEALKVYIKEKELVKAKKERQLYLSLKEKYGED